MSGTGSNAYFPDEEPVAVDVQLEPQLDFLSRDPREVPYGVVAFDTGLIIAWCDTAAEKMFGWVASEIIGKHIDFVLPHFSRDHYGSLSRSVGAHAGKDHVRPVLTMAERKDGSQFPIEVSLSSFVASDVDLSIAILHDRTSDLSWEQKLQMLATAVSYSGDCVLITDRNGIVQYVNPAFEKTTGYNANEIVGKTPRVLKSDHHSSRFYRNLWNAICEGKVFRARFVNNKKDGGVIYEEKTISPILDEAGKITHFVSTAKDVTERVLTEQRLAYVASHDSLTGLPNRNLFREKLEQALATASLSGTCVAVLDLDVDRFKGINDSLGHSVGDHLLQIAAQRLKYNLSEANTIIRLGGDEFCILAGGLPNDQAAISVVDQVYDAFKTSFEVNNRTFTLSTSIGVSLYPRDGSDADTLLRRADTAMYQAKKQGGNTCRFYSSVMGEKVDRDLLLETDLRGVIDREELQLYYQPQMDLVTGRITAVEALLRWAHPERGLIAPAEFIPILEDTGLIHEVGRWVIRNGCWEIRRIHESQNVPLKLAVNLSGRQFKDPELAEYIREVLTETGLEPSLLEVEITETVLMDHETTTLDTLGRFESMGIRLSIDDFGTGYSSLGYLRRFKIDTLKIDRSFIVDLRRDNDATTIVKTIIALMRNFGIRVVAEGVETREQRDMLHAMQCDAVQGYLIKEPMSFDRLQCYIAETDASLPT